MTEDVNFVCDLCGHQTDSREDIMNHVRDEHDVDEPVEVGRVDQSEEDVLKLQHADGTEIRIDLAQWLKDQLSDKK